MRKAERERNRKAEEYRAAWDVHDPPLMVLAIHKQYKKFVPNASILWVYLGLGIMSAVIVMFFLKL